MTKELLIEALAKVFSGIVLVGLLIFLPAGTIDFPNGWLLMGLLFIPMLFAGIVLMFKNPVLLEKRLKSKEEQPEQKTIIFLSGFMFIAGFIAAGLNFRFGWNTLPKTVVLLASVIFIIAYILYAVVIKENEYLSRIIKVQEGQKVIDKGLYRIVRHPMYSVTLLLFLSMPIILGSLYSFLIFLLYPFLIKIRIRHEEELLTKELSGYAEYKQKVKYRLIPFIW